MLTSFVYEELHVITSASSQTDKYFGFSLALIYCKGILFYIVLSNGSLKPDTFSTRKLFSVYFIFFFAVLILPAASIYGNNF